VFVPISNRFQTNRPADYLKLLTRQLGQIAGREPQALQRLEPAAVHGLPHRVQLHHAARYEDAVPGPGEQSAVQAREALLLHLVCKFLQAFHLALRPKLQGDQGLGVGAQAVADVIPRHDEVATLVVAAADDDVRVGVAGVEVVDGDPVQPGVEVLFHLPHQVADEGLQVRQSGAVLGRDDEAELVRVALAAVQEGAAVGLVAGGVIEPARQAVPGDAVALDVAQWAFAAPRSPARWRV
jgi:hypothetical protein